MLNLRVKKGGCRGGSLCLWCEWSGPLQMLFDDWRQCNLMKSDVLEDKMI